MTIPPLSSSQPPSNIPSSSRFEIKIEALAPQLFDTAKERGSPFAPLTALLGSLFQLAHQSAKDSDGLVDTCEKLLKQNQDFEAATHIRQFATQFVKNQTDAVVNNEKNINYLNKKLSKILVESGTPPEAQKEIISTVLRDFITFLNESQVRVLEDVSNGELQPLNVHRDDSLIHIESLGDETHHGGKVPLLLTFKSGQKIVYKPRSMMPEHVICSKLDSVFAAAGLGTYEVICKSDARGDYGYCEYLQNQESENTMKTPEDVTNYFTKLAKLDQMCKALGISDVHYGNIITDKKIPFLIDAESFLNPDFMQTGIYEENGAANTFDPQETDIHKISGKNKIWFDPLLTNPKVPRECFDFKMTKEDLKSIGVDLDTVKPSPLSRETLGKIAHAKQRLMNGRFVLLDTETLKGAILRTDPNNSEQLQFFLIDLQNRIKELGFQYVEGQELQILEKFKGNITHNDVPVFYYNAISRSILYEGITIAKLFAV